MEAAHDAAFAKLRRNATAICWMAAGLLWLAGIALTPWEADGANSDEGFLRELDAHPLTGQIAAVLLHFAYLLVVPAAFGSLGILRGRGRALGYAGVAFAVVGFATLPGLLITDFYGLALMDNVTPEEAVAVHVAVGEDYPWSLAIFIPTLLGGFVGMALLLAALWRARALPLWAAILPFAGFVALQVTPATLLARTAAAVVLAIGFVILAACLARIAPAEWAAGERAPLAAMHDA